MMETNLRQSCYIKHYQTWYHWQHYSHRQLLTAEQDERKQKAVITPGRMLPRGKVDRSQGDMAGLPVNEAVGGVTWVESPCCHPVCDRWLSSPFPWQWPILLPTCHAACPCWNTALKRRCKDLVLLHSQKSICFGKLKSNINTQGWCFVIPP